MNVRQFINKWVILGALAVAGLLLLITAVAIGLTSSPQTSSVGFAPADLTVIPAPTGTSGAPPTPTIDPFASPTPPAGGVGEANGSMVGVGGAPEVPVGAGITVKSAGAKPVLVV